MRLNQVIVLQRVNVELEEACQKYCLTTREAEEVKAALLDQLREEANQRDQSRILNEDEGI